MTVVSNVKSASPAGPSPSSTAAKALIGSLVAGFLALAGITFMALAVAFPIVVPLIQDQHLPVKPGDLELAKTFASFSWAFVVAGIATLVGAVVIAVKLVQNIDPAPAE